MSQMVSIEVLEDGIAHQYLQNLQSAYNHLDDGEYIDDGEDEISIRYTHEISTYSAAAIAKLETLISDTIVKLNEDIQKQQEQIRSLQNLLAQKIDEES